jgi:hypothetical protein
VRARVKAAQFSTFVLVENRVVVALVNVSYWGRWRGRGVVTLVHW